MSSCFRRREHRKIEPLRLRGWPGVTPKMKGAQLMSSAPMRAWLGHLTGARLGLAIIGCAKRHGHVCAPGKRTVLHHGLTSFGPSYHPRLPLGLVRFGLP